MTESRSSVASALGGEQTDWDVYKGWWDTRLFIMVEVKWYLHVKTHKKSLYLKQVYVDYENYTSIKYIFKAFLWRLT